MPVEIRIVTDSKLAAFYLRRIQRKLGPKGGMDRALRAVAFRAWRRLAIRTPKWTGQTASRWTVVRFTGGGWAVVNPHKVMRFLELGTKAHGPKRARYLWIPLSLAVHTTGPQPGHVYGRHFILAKRVRGIRAHRIVEDERQVTALDLQRELIKRIKKIIRAP